jgi:hypothetical protein
VTISDYYAQVNAAWPKPIPRLDPEEAKIAGRKLYRFAFGRPFRGTVRVTSGRRYTWIRRSEMAVNPERGWHDLVHGLSHYAHMRLNTGERPHSKRHARLELAMVKEVIKRGWLDGRLLIPALNKAEREKQAADQREDVSWKIAHLEGLEKKWRTKAKRAATALKKLARKKKRLLMAS